MEKILLFARDPAGANVILPVYRKLKRKYRTVLWAKDFAWERLSREQDCEVINFSAECSSGTCDEIVRLLQEKNISIVITATSLDDYTERYMWKAAGMLHIKSFAILDQWMNLGIRFSRYDYKQIRQYEKEHSHLFFPYRILAMDHLTKKLLIEDGVPEEKIIITGQPHFDTVFSSYQKAHEAYNRDCYNIVFASEPLLEDYDGGDSQNSYWGYNEVTIFETLYRQVTRIAPDVKRKVRIILRPHPRESAGKWDIYRKECKNNWITIVCDRSSDNFSVIKAADLICGMSSMFLLEAMICQREVLSIEIGLKRENPFVLDQVGICKSILTEEALYKDLKDIMISAAQGCKKEINFSYIKNATDRVAAVIEEEMKNG